MKLKKCYKCGGRPKPQLNKQTRYRYACDGCSRITKWFAMPELANISWNDRGWQR